MLLWKLLLCFCYSLKKIISITKYLRQFWVLWCCLYQENSLWYSQGHWSPDIGAVLVVVKFFSKSSLNVLQRSIDDAKALVVVFHKKCLMQSSLQTTQIIILSFQDFPCKPDLEVRSYTTTNSNYSTFLNKLSAWNITYGLRFLH